jgi:dipeptidyl aminopeptidase/acylaminoacyl peptidase
MRARTLLALAASVVCMASPASASAGSGVILVQRTLPDASAPLGARTDLFLLSPDGSEIARLTDDPAQEFGARLTDDGERVVFSSTRGGGNAEIWTMRTDGSDLQRITHDSIAADLWPDVSPDGTKVVWVKQQPGGAGTEELWVADIDGSNAQEITSNTWTDTDPAFSPDGRRIAYLSNAPAGKGGSQLDTIAVDGTHRRLVLKAAVALPHWSPDGTRIAFVDLAGNGGWAIDSIAADGSDRQVVVDEPQGFESFPVWSPDGDHIDYAWNPDWPSSGTIQVANVLASGGHGRTITNDPYDTVPLDWADTPSGPELVKAPNVVANGHAFRANPGRWSSASDLAFSFQWQTCTAGGCTDIAGATGQRLTSASLTDPCQAVRVVVTATDAGGAATRAPSAAFSRC